MNSASERNMTDLLATTYNIYFFYFAVKTQLHTNREDTTRSDALMDAHKIIIIIFAIYVLIF